MKRLFGALGAWLLAAAAVSAADVSELVKQLKSANADERRAAAEALGKAGKDAKDAAPALIAALKDSDLFVRTFAAQALGDVGADPKTVAAALQAVMKNTREKEEVHEAALASLGKLGGEGVPALAEVVGDQNRDADLRHKAIRLLAQIGPAARSTVPMLTDLAVAKAKNPKQPPRTSMELRVDALNALGAIATPDDKEAVDALTEMAATEKLDRNLKMAVVPALKKIKERK
jgi:HEAT repeat protein